MAAEGLHRDPDGCMDSKVRSHKDGSMKQAKVSTPKPGTAIAGVDVGKHWLDAALFQTDDAGRFANSEQGRAELLAWLHQHQISRVGLEASGGYEQPLCQMLGQHGLECVLHQPIEVRLFARLRRLRAKNDRLDARLIALATASLGSVRAAADPMLAELAQILAAYEHVRDQAAQTKTFLELCTTDELRSPLLRQLQATRALKAQLAEAMIARLQANAHLARRFDLLQSLPGIGRLVAAVLLIRMPELGSLQRGKAACLLGVAPFDRDSGTRQGQRHIQGGRAGPRRFLYLAALAARRASRQFDDLPRRLLNKGRQPKVAIVAVMRKLIEAANLVLARQTPWTKSIPT